MIFPWLLLAGILLVSAALLVDVAVAATALATRGRVRRHRSRRIVAGLTLLLLLVVLAWGLVVLPD